MNEGIPMSNVQTSGPRRFYSAGEVAGMFGVSRMTIYRAINDGTIPAIQVRDRWVVPAVAVEGMVHAAIARAEALVAARPPDDDVGVLDRYMDRSRPGANQTGAGSPATQQGARGEASRMTYSGSDARAVGGAR
jgi:excisionase family DNA binding protein